MKKIIGFTNQPALSEMRRNAKDVTGARPTDGVAHAPSVKAPEVAPTQFVDAKQDAGQKVAAEELNHEPVPQRPDPSWTAGEQLSMARSFVRHDLGQIGEMLELTAVYTGLGAGVGALLGGLVGLAVGDPVDGAVIGAKVGGGLLGGLFTLATGAMAFDEWQVQRSLSSFVKAAVSVLLHGRDAPAQMNI